MKNIGYTILIIFGLAVFFRCSYSESNSKSAFFNSEDDKQRLGKALFFEKKISNDGSISCATCHQPTKDFTDGKFLSKGVLGKTALRNAPNLYHLKDQPYFMMDGGVPTLEQQILVPIQDINEMGSKMSEVIIRLKKNKYYAFAAKKLYNREFDVYVLTRSIAAYLKSIVPRKTKFDLFWEGDSSAFNELELKGYKLFTGQLKCVKCHQPPKFTNYKIENNGATRIAENDLGRYRIDGKKSSIGKFKVPNLRGIKKTGPYFHDGSVKTLEEIVEIYAHGGYKTVNQSTEIKPFDLSPTEKKALVHFLKTL